MDEVLVMDGGRVVERGTHDQLLLGGGRYSSLWWEEARHAVSNDVEHQRPREPMVATWVAP